VVKGEVQVPETDLLMLLCSTIDYTIINTAARISRV
jgi:hypothetical protein